MIKNNATTLKKLESILEEADYTVRYERGNFHSGWCLLEQKSIVILNKFLDTEGRINILTELVPQLHINYDKLTLASQQLYDYVQGIKAQRSTSNIASSTKNNNHMQQLNISEKDWGSINGENVKLYTLTNGAISVNISNYGGIIQAILVHAEDESTDNIVTGYATPAEYEADKSNYFGALVGRFANRIAKGKFSIDGNAYSLPVNNGENSLHGGIEGFNRKVWTMLEEMKTENEVGITMQYISEDGEEGYPGNLKTEVSYRLDHQNRLSIHYTAHTDKATPISLTNHSYFNLNGFKSNVTEHALKVHADAHTVKDDKSVATGKLASLAPGHPLYFGDYIPLKNNIHQFPEDKGYDHNFLLTTQPFNEVKLAAELKDPATGRQLNVYTDQPGLQIYAGNWWDGSAKGLHSNAYSQYDAIALETQAIPNSPNVPEFPSSILHPGDTYKSTTIYEFLV